MDIYIPVGLGRGEAAWPNGDHALEGLCFLKMGFSEVWIWDLNCFTFKTVVCLYLQVSVDHSVLWNSCLIIKASKWWGSVEKVLVFSGIWVGFHVMWIVIPETCGNVLARWHL